MSVNRFKLALNAARFPLVSTKASRAVMVPGLDLAPKTHYIYKSAIESLDPNLPQLIYGENFMPVSEGVHSVGYATKIAATINKDFDQIFALRDADENTVLYSPAAGKNYIFDHSMGYWTTTTFMDIHGVAIAVGSPHTEAEAKVTRAYVDGKTFVCYSRLLATGSTDASILYWNAATKSLEPAGALISSLPFPAGEIDGIASSNGYLIVYSKLTVAWAAFNGMAFDFTIYANNAFTGSGYQIPEDIKGTITAVISVSGGFVIFTKNNAIASTYNLQNLQSPWVFREVPGAGGITDYEQATVEGSLGYIIAYTTSGMQKITLNSSEDMFTDVSDFISGRYIERYNFSDHSLSAASTTLDMYVKVTSVGNRFTVISYGTFPKVYSFALVYDSALKRWGKLRMVHRDCFYYSYGEFTASLTYSMLGDVPYDSSELTTYEATTQQSTGSIAAQHALAFLLETGEIKLADWSDQLRDTQDDAVVVLGRLQLTRTSNVQLNRVELEGLNTGEIYIQPSYNGADLQPTQSLVTIESTAARRLAGGLIDCKNFNIVVEGTFNLTTVLLEATNAGSM